MVTATAIVTVLPCRRPMLPKRGRVRRAAPVRSLHPSRPAAVRPARLHQPAAAVAELGPGRTRRPDHSRRGLPVCARCLRGRHDGGDHQHAGLARAGARLPGARRQRPGRVDRCGALRGEQLPEPHLPQGRGRGGGWSRRDFVRGRPELVIDLRPILHVQQL